MSDEKLRLSYDRIMAFRAEKPTDRANCPDVETMLSILRRQGTDGSRLLFLDHIMACPFCQPEFALLKTVGIAQPPE
jgi:hypothetical protein